MSNRQFYAMVLGALAAAAAIGSIGSFSLASAQAPDEAKTFTVEVTRIGGPADVFYSSLSAFPEITGSVDAGDELMSRVGVGFAEAAGIAADAGNGSVIGGNLTIEQGYVVYVFRVFSDDTQKMVIVDAGNGSVLHVSEGTEMDALAALGGHGQFGFGAVKVFKAPEIQEEQ
ncbi:hypothetical protein [Nitrososphaera sp.]|uniref:hypothetical protein n=1 Tax=Nitrososphaera sp. TaxID=1971748 RepID=UPI003181CF9C